MMPTRYTLDVDLKSAVPTDVLDNWDKKDDARRVRSLDNLRDHHSQWHFDGGNVQRCSAPGLARIAESRNVPRAACATPDRASEWADRLTLLCARAGHEGPAAEEVRHWQEPVVLPEAAVRCQHPRPSLIYLPDPLFDDTRCSGFVEVPVHLHRCSGTA